MNMCFKRLLFVGLVFSAWSGGIHAQDYAFQGFAAADAMNQMHAAARDAMTEPAEPDDDRPVVATTYRASAAVSARTQEQFIEFVESTSGPEAAGRLRGIFQDSDPVAIWANLVRNEGLRSGDTVDAMTAYWLLNWMMATGGEGSRTKAMAVRGQVRSWMADSPSFVGLDDAARQEMAEVLMLNFLVQHATFDDAVRRGDQQMIRRLGEAAVARFQAEMKLDLRRLRLTESGFLHVAR